MRPLVIKLTAREDEREKISQAFTVAAMAIAAGAPVSLWLTGDSVTLAQPGQAEQFELPHSADLAQLRDSILANGTLTACVQCLSRRNLEQGDLIDDVRVAGAAAFVEESLADNAQALVY